MRETRASLDRREAVVLGLITAAGGPMMLADLTERVGRCDAFRAGSADVLRETVKRTVKRLAKLGAVELRMTRGVRPVLVVRLVDGGPPRRAEGQRASAER